MTICRCCVPQQAVGSLGGLPAGPCGDISLFRGRVAWIPRLLPVLHQLSQVWSWILSVLLTDRLKLTALPLCPCYINYPRAYIFAKEITPKSGIIVLKCGTKKKPHNCKASDANKVAKSRTYTPLPKKSRPFLYIFLQIFPIFGAALANCFIRSQNHLPDFFPRQSINATSINFLRIACRSVARGGTWVNDVLPSQKINKFAMMKNWQ